MTAILRACAHSQPRQPRWRATLLPVQDALRQADRPGLHRPLQVLRDLRLLRQLPLLMLPAAVHVLQHHLPAQFLLQLPELLVVLAQVPRVLSAKVQLVRHHMPAGVPSNPTVLPRLPSKVPPMLPAKVQLVRHPVSAAVLPRPLRLQACRVRPRAQTLAPFGLHPASSSELPNPP